ncbi:MAG TPA: endo-1,4-beta-xylanase [Thermogutta sp.]|nr:endo-1,4-beta-xylanase [Thermogutta sp.]
MKALNDPRELSLKFIVLGSLWAMAVSLGATYAESPKPTASFDEVWQSYQSRWRKPEIQARIAEGIEKHRKQDITIRVVDAEGQPVPDVHVQVIQQTHAFLFGCNAFVLGQLGSEEKNRRYEEAFAHLFNFATVPFYWSGTEPEQGQLRYAEGSPEIWRRPPPDRFIPWAEKYGITLKGHPLLWHAHNPSWLPKDPEALKALYRKRFKEIAERYAGKIKVWDVVNESLVASPSFPLFTEDRDYVRWAFQEVAPLFPEDTVLMINEVTSFNTPPQVARYRDQIRGLLAAGASVRGIGLQFHYFRREALENYLRSENSDPAKLLEGYQILSELGLPLYITGITIPSAGEQGEEIQAELVRNLYRLWFSVAMMAGITWWNLADGTAVQGENEARGGLMTEDLQPKPAYRELEQLIHQEWETRANGQTDQEGTYRVRGFHGRYLVRVGKESTWVVRTLTVDQKIPATLEVLWVENK